MEDNSQLADKIDALKDKIDEYQNEVSQWRYELGQRVSSIETTIKPAIMGNGQPSRLASVETRVSELEKGHWIQAGRNAAFASIAVAGWELAKKYFGI